MPIRLRDLSQGALLHVVVALLTGPMKAEQIARKTGKSHETVQRALETLESEFKLVFAVPDGRWPVWSLRDTNQLELLLPGLAGEAAAESAAEFVDSPPSVSTQISNSARSSSSLTINYESKNLLLLPVSTQISNSPESQSVINQLTRMGATPGRAEKAIAAALGRDESLATISERIAALANYAASRRSIRNPGQWALGYIATGCALPEDARTAASDYSGYRPYLAREEGEGEGGREGEGEEGS